MGSAPKLISVDPVLAEALEKLNDGFTVFGADQRASYVNSVARRRFSSFYAALERGETYVEAVMSSLKLAKPDGLESERRAVAEKLLEYYNSGDSYETATEDGRIVRISYQDMTENRKVAISVDITDLRQSERELKRLEREAVAASNAKSAFLANMSHEIRTPLNGIMGMAQVLEMGELNSDQREQVSTILDSGRNLMAILNDVLDLSKIEAGRTAIVPADADIAHVLKGLHRLWKPKAEEAGLEFKLSLDADLPPMLNFDAVRVRQCVSNLISNAIKFTPRGRIDVAVGTQPIEDGRHMVSIAITDTGLGMDSETLGRLFKPFEQADDSTSRKYGGTGLGLSIVRKLAELMDGQANATSEVGKGSCFTFSFVAGPALSLAPSGRKIPVGLPDAGDLADSISGLRVLLVDDHPVNRHVANLVLAPFQMHIVEATNGQEALDALAVQGFDLVLLDMHMPVMDGPQTIAAIRGSDSDWKTVPVIALTADAMSGDRDRYMRMGMDGYLSKPLVVTDMLAEIGRVRRATAAAASEDALDDAGKTAAA